MCTRAVCVGVAYVSREGGGCQSSDYARFADPHKHKIVAKSTSR